MNNQVPSGVIAINKPAGWTSFDVVAKLRGVLGIRKIGHTGTLDPDATGVLVICVGKATSLVESLSKHDKIYETVMLLGTVTDTQDISGKVLSKCDDIPDLEVIQKAINAHVGDIDQIPPMYSAKKVDGKKLYELAREGKEVDRKPSKITVYSIDIADISLPRVSLRISCSGGTYIRTLCHDIGRLAGPGACMESLHRTKVGDVDIGDTYTLDKVETMVKAGDCGFLMPIDSFYKNLPRIDTKGSTAKLVENGAMIPLDLLGNTVEKRVRIYHPDGRFAGVYSIENKIARVEKFFLE